MHFIEHIAEPTRLLLAWQSFSDEHRTRYIVAELNHTIDDATLTYLIDTDDFHMAQKEGFKGYPAFPDPNVNKIYKNVMGTFMRRLPPKTRGDFSEYLEGFRIKPDAQLSDFALLGYSGAKLLSDSFSIIDPFDNINGPCELLVEATGFRHLEKEGKELSLDDLKLDDPVSFEIDTHALTQEEVIRMVIKGKTIGTVNRGLAPSVLGWVKNNLISNAWIEKKNGTPDRPAVYVYLEKIA